MADDTVTIEVDGEALQARKGAMLIEVTDAAGIHVPRFCYHKHLSVAANCRMCLVEVEKAPKPLPACATPVADGMKVHTRSALALDAQRSTMEFLLINHPLDCPICDQGGECELQDLSLGYGHDVSRYTERKRVVRDKDIGPLISTEMTRCIHCTRCVRFGEEIAGVRELGATGRGEHMEIGTYIERAVGSELSGNVIDLCPVGALTSRPFRFSARAWEMRQYPAIGPHDSVGSNLYLHAKGQRVKRVVPRENEAVNETWIADRDRYSYEGLYHDERLTAPRIRERGQWREVDWDTALDFVAAGLRRLIGEHGAGAVGVLASPAATLEELYLLQKLARALGIANIDHRLHQADFSDQDQAPAVAWLGRSIASLQALDAALLIGANPRKDQPLINHRLRKAALRGARIAALDAVAFEANLPLAERIVAGPQALLAELAALARALDADAVPGQAPVEDRHRRIAALLRDAGDAVVLIGNFAASHPQLAALRALAVAIARAAGAHLGYLPEAANSVGAALAGALPHLGPGAAPAGAGLHARAMFEQPRQGYLLLGVEPELDCQDPARALHALEQAGFVTAFGAYRTPVMERYAHALLPIALYAETPGTFVNCAGAWQDFEAAVRPPGEARPAWRVLRVLGNRCELPGFEQHDAAQVRAEIEALAGTPGADLLLCAGAPAAAPAPDAGLQRITVLAPHAIDALVRRAPALQRTADAGDGCVHVHPQEAAALGVGDGAPVRIGQAGAHVQAPLRVDARVPPGCAMVYGARIEFAGLGPWSGTLTVAPV